MPGDELIISTGYILNSTTRNNTDAINNLSRLIIKQKTNIPLTIYSRWNG